MTDSPRHDRDAGSADRASIGRRLWLGLIVLHVDAVGVQREPRRAIDRDRAEPARRVFVTSALALGVAIPSSPGYIGTYQWIGVAALGLLDVPVEQALAFSILMQATWYVPTTLAGGAVIGCVRSAAGPCGSPIRIRSEDDDLRRRYSHRDDLGRRSAAERGAFARDAVPGDRERPRAARPRLRGRVRRRRLDRRKPLGPRTASRRDGEHRQSCTCGGTSARPRHCRPASSRPAATSSSPSTPTSRTTRPRFPKLLAKLEEGFDLVSGWKTRRNDPFARGSSRASSTGRPASISGVHLHDVNCGLKAYRAEVLQGMRLYGELHRFIPVLAVVPRVPDGRDSR